MKISNERMLSFFAQTDEHKYYSFCHAINMSKKSFKILEMCFFVKDADMPSEEFVCIEIHEDCFAVIYVNTENEALVNEAVDILLKRQDICEYLLVTSTDNVLEMPYLTSVFEISGIEYEANPSYSINSYSELNLIETSNGVEIFRLTDENSMSVKKELEHSKKDFESWTFEGSEAFSDIRIYILRVNGVLCGYLRAECGYANYYDIGWLHIVPNMRKRGYAAQLVSYFAQDCVKYGLHPNYGYAVCPQSEKVAQKCGFKLDKKPKYRRELIKKQINKEI